MNSIPLSKIDFFLFTVLVGLSTAFGTAYCLIKRQLSPLSLKVFFFTLGLTFLYFLLLSASSLWYIVDVRWNFAFVCVLSLLGGILFARAMFIHRPAAQQDIQTDVLLAVFLCFIGITAYYLGYSLWSAYLLESVDELGNAVQEKSNAALFASGAVIPFLLPFFIQLSYQLYVSIPVKIYPKWFYPVDDELPAYPYEANRDPHVGISLKFQTRHSVPNFQTIGTFAPRDIILGDFIRYTFEEWNLQAELPEQIEFKDAFGRGLPFLFTAFKDEQLKDGRRLDPNKTVAYNQIQKDEVITVEKQTD